MAEFLLDSGDPLEYKDIAALAKKHNSLLWGATTNPTLIAKKLAGPPGDAARKKLSKEEAFRLQKEIVLEIIDVVPGAVSAEVYADFSTTAQEMIEQGREIAKWHERVVVKLPTTIESFSARTQLRKDGITINNTLVFSQEQVFAISLHEKILQEKEGVKKQFWPPFISPFVGRLDDIDQDGMSLIKHCMLLQKTYFPKDLTWILESSVRSVNHIKQGIAFGTDILTIPAKVLTEWFENSSQSPTAVFALTPIPLWQPSTELTKIDSLDGFMEALTGKKLDISHELTTKGIERFASDWKAILS